MDIEKAKPETIKALTAAAELLMSAINKGKAGEELDPKGLGKIVDALNAVKTKYPAAKSGDIEKAKAENVKALTAAHETLMSIVNKVKDGATIDPKGVGKVIDAIMGVKEKYPYPKAKAMDAAEFVSYAKSQLEEIEKAEPATRVARLAQLQANIENAKKQIDEGKPTIEIEERKADEGTSTNVSPFAAGSFPVSNFEALQASIQELTTTVKEFKDSVKKTAPEPEAERSWPDDMSGDPAKSTDPAVNWGAERRPDIDRDWGKDSN